MEFEYKQVIVKLSEEVKAEEYLHKEFFRIVKRERHDDGTITLYGERPTTWRMIFLQRLLLPYRYI